MWYFVFKGMEGLPAEPPHPVGVMEYIPLQHNNSPFMSIPVRFDSESEGTFWMLHKASLSLLK
jgi:hypothetical protein